tara:strand:- start:137 stop:262 length:126 start_codon:yes stop_codon:yes gene_type:complete
MALQPLEREEMDMQIEGISVTRWRLLGGVVLLGLIILVIKK